MRHHSTISKLEENIISRDLGMENNNPKKVYDEVRHEAQSRIAKEEREGHRETIGAKCNYKGQEFSEGAVITQDDGLKYECRSGEWRKEAV
jgi:hypothetical protein